MHFNVLGNAPAAVVVVAVVVAVDLEYGPNFNVKRKPANFRLDFVVKFSYLTCAPTICCSFGRFNSCI